MILNYAFMIILVIFVMTIMRMLTYNSAQVPELSTIKMWAMILNCSCVILTIIIISKFCIVGLSQEVLPYILAYVLFIAIYWYSLFTVARFIVW